MLSEKAHNKVISTSMDRLDNFDIYRLIIAVRMTEKNCPIR